MDIEFHYYITYILAKESGFDPENTDKIAYASQYTDDNCIKIRITQEDGSEYQNYISQTMNILNPINKLARIYSCFHFLPGHFDCQSAARIDGSLHILNTTPKSSNADIILDSALESGDPYRIGISTHVFADTWAHQNFIGFRHSFAAVGYDDLCPNIGHAEAGHKPDIPNLVWIDTRLSELYKKVNNKQRFIDASEHIFRKFCEHNKTSFQDKWPALRDKLDWAIGECSADVKDCQSKSSWRIESYKSIGKMTDFDETDWLNKAVDLDKTKCDWLKDHIPGFKCVSIIFGWICNFFRDKLLKKPEKIKLTGRAKPLFEQSDWYQFQEAVKNHQETVIEMLEPLYKQMALQLQDSF